MTKILIWVVSILSIMVGAGIAVAGPGSRLGFWDYGYGLSLIRQLALPAMVAAGASLIAFALAILKARALTILALLAFISASVAAYVPVAMKAAFEGNPFIHDITTDFDNPPKIIAGAEEARVNPPLYSGDEFVPRTDITVKQAQLDAFPDIRPIETSLSVVDAAEKAKAVIKDMNMKLLSDGPLEEDSWRVEAAYTSQWFGFIDDFIVRIEPTETGSIVNIRSKSRMGGSDLGANAARVRAFIDAFNA